MWGYNTDHNRIVEKWFEIWVYSSLDEKQWYYRLSHGNVIPCETIKGAVKLKKLYGKD